MKKSYLLSLVLLIVGISSTIKITAENKKKKDENLLSKKFEEVCKLYKEEDLKKSEFIKNNLYTRDEKGWTLMHVAAGHPNPRLVKYLLKQGVPADIKMKGDMVPLHKIDGWRRDREHMAKILLDKMDNIDQRSIHGATPLMHVTFDGDVKIVKWLLKRGANPNIITTEGKTPLWRAAIKYSFNRRPKHRQEQILYEKIIKLLIKYEADPLLVNKKGNSVLTELVHSGGVKRLSATKFVIDEYIKKNGSFEFPEEQIKALKKQFKKGYRGHPPGEILKIKRLYLPKKEQEEVIEFFQKYVKTKKKPKGKKE